MPRPRLTKIKISRSLGFEFYGWFPVQDIVYVKKDVLSKTNEYICYPRIICFSFILLATIKLYIKVNKQIIVDRKFYANF